MRRPRVLLFDSGMGGLTVARATKTLIPDADYIYAADTAAFPYGAWDEPPLVERICRVVGRVIEATAPDVVVVGCNTASTLALAELRKRFPMPFVGTVPAIKPAAAQTKSRIIGVLATPGTVSREYTQTLIHTFAFHCRVFLHGARWLAEIAEGKLKGGKADMETIRQEIRPVFRRREGRRTDTVVLGCTHYPLLIDELTAAAPWPVTFIDPAPAIARRVKALLGEQEARPELREGLPPAGSVVFTSPRAMHPEQVAIYAGEGFANAIVLDLPI
ncbi:MAG: glutamate racemase [Parvibaculaceae bacterium]